MAEREINRQAWADLVGALLAEETAGNKSAFARMIGVEYKTINRWLGGTVDVSEASVRRVADTLGRNPFEMLVAVGYYRQDEIELPPPRNIDYDEEIDHVTQSDLPPRVKRRIIEQLLAMREEDKERRRRIVDIMIEQARDAS